MVGSGIRSTCVGVLALLLALLPARALAIPPLAYDFPETDAVPLDFTFLFENDNKFFSLWTVIGRDGSDVGRTHGLTLRLGGPIRRARFGRWDLEIASNLFTTQLYAPDGTRLNLRPDGTPDPQRWQNRNVWFNELTTGRLAFTGRVRRNRFLTYQLAIGAVVSNHERVGPSGTGQQKWFHKFLAVFGKYTREYRYVDDGLGTYGGATLDASLRWSRRVWVRRYLVVTLRSDAGLALNTIRYGSALVGSAGVWLGLGQRRWHDNAVLDLALTQQISFFPGNAAALLDLRVDMFFHTRPADLMFSFDGYFGNPNRDYYTYNFNNSTVTMGMRIRMR